MSHQINHLYEFEEFRLDTENPSLWREGKLVSISPKALEILILLVEKKGAIVLREELLETVWKETFVEEGNINYTISLLRKTLGKKDLIQTVARRGYRFNAEIREIDLQKEILNAEPSENLVNKINELPEISQKSNDNFRPKRWQIAALAVISLLLVTSFAVWMRERGKPVSAANRNIKTIAVLPFKNLDENDRENAVSRGLTDALISRFGSLNRFTVRPFDSVEKFSKSGKDALQFGAELKCDAVLEGTFQQIENRLRVNVRLLDIRDGAQLWTANFDETEIDIFKIQDKISNQVANSLIKNLTAQDTQILNKKATENPEAFRAYIRGRMILDLRNQDNRDKAAVEFQRAVRLDPGFALAYTGLADTFSSTGNALTGAEADEAYIKAKFYALKSLELDGESAEAHTSLGRIKRIHDWDWEGAENDFKRAIALNPNYANAHLFYAQMLSFLGRHDEALAEINRASEINPISQTISGARFAILESCGKYDEALKLTEESIKFDPESRNFRRALGTILFHKGEYARVIEMGNANLEKQGEPKFAWLSLVSSSYRRTNQIEQAEITLRQLEELAQSDSKAVYSTAMNYAELNRIDEAIAALQKSLEMREERMAWINVEPRFTNLRTDERFRDLVKKMRLSN